MSFEQENFLNNYGLKQDNSFKEKFESLFQNKSEDCMRCGHSFSIKDLNNLLTDKRIYLICDKCKEDIFSKFKNQLGNKIKNLLMFSDE